VIILTNLDEIMLGGERRSQVEARQAEAVSRWPLVMTSRRETRLRPWDEHVQSVSGKEKSQRRMLFLVSSVQSSRNGDIPLKKQKIINIILCSKNIS
jgi:hypothetical protein